MRELECVERVLDIELIGRGLIQCSEGGGDGGVVGVDHT